MIRREVLAGGSAAMAGTAATRVSLDATQLGARGDGASDDAPAIQAALDRLGQSGGGTLFLPQPPVHYRLGRGLTIPSHVALEGTTQARYPFNGGNVGACALVADFADPRQWVIEAATRIGGRPVPHDALVAGDLPDGVSYDCAVRNLLVTSRGTVPYGGIRMHGCPGAVVEGVAVHRVGCGLLVNYSFGGHFSVQVRPLYYGVAAWDEANANTFEVYCAHAFERPTRVPADYRLPFMAQMQGHFADTLKLSGDEHGSRPYGVLCGSIASTSTGNVFDAVVEHFPGGVFLYNAYATDFRRCYLEAEAGAMACAIAASRSRFGVQALHAYLSGTGTLFDFGIDVRARIFSSGLLHAASFGKAPEDDGASLLILEGMGLDIAGAPLQPGLRYLAGEPPWLPLRLEGGWQVAEDEAGDEQGAAAASAPAVRLDPWSHRVELRGAMEGGQRGRCFTLPPLCRPATRRRLAVYGGALDIAADGTARIVRHDGVVALDGAGFPRW